MGLVAVVRDVHLRVQAAQRLVVALGVVAEAVERPTLNGALRSIALKGQRLAQLVEAHLPRHKADGTTLVPQAKQLSDKLPRHERGDSQEVAIGLIAALDEVA